MLYGRSGCKVVDLYTCKGVDLYTEKAAKEAEA